MVLGQQCLETSEDDSGGILSHESASFTYDEAHYLYVSENHIIKSYVQTPVI